MSRALVWTLYAALVTIWSSTWVVIAVGLEDVAPFFGAGLRFTLAGVGVLGAAAALKRPLRTDTALESLRALAENPDLLVGAGTVLRPAQVEAALEAGARYIVSPGFSASVVSGVPALRGPVRAHAVSPAVNCLRPRRGPCPGSGGRDCHSGFRSAAQGDTRGWDAEAHVFLAGPAPLALLLGASVNAGPL